MGKLENGFMKRIGTEIGKSFLAAFLFYIVYAFLFGILFGERHPLLFMVDKYGLTAYTIAGAIFGSIPYMLFGYIYILARNNYDNLGKKLFRIAMIQLIFLLVIFAITYVLQLYRPYVNNYQIYTLLNYPPISFILPIGVIDNGENILNVLTAVLPSLFTIIGGSIRIVTLKKGGNYGQDN